MKSLIDDAPGHGAGGLSLDKGVAFLVAKASSISPSPADILMERSLADGQSPR